MTTKRIITPFDPDYVAQVKIAQPGRLPKNPTKGWLGASTARLTREERILQHRHGGAYMRAVERKGSNPDPIGPKPPAPPNPPRAPR